MLARIRFGTWREHRPRVAAVHDHRLVLLAPVSRFAVLRPDARPLVCKSLLFDDLAIGKILHGLDQHEYRLVRASMPPRPALEFRIPGAAPGPTGGTRWSGGAARPRR